jgi:diketogulonate reductase-like aldo/keto reductase
LQKTDNNALQPGSSMTMTTAIPSITLNNGVQLPELGLGVFQSPPAQTTVAVEAAIACGYPLIDTAASYLNEREVGLGMTIPD